MEQLPAILNSIQPIIEILAWPIMVLIVSLVALFLFRPQLAALLERIKSIGRSGLDTYDLQQPKPKPIDEKNALEDYFKTFDNQLVLKIESLIKDDLEKRGILTADNREKALVRELATTQIARHFERVRYLIWASQLVLLRNLNANVSGTDVAIVGDLYEMAKNRFPQLYENYPIERWLDFLESNHLIIRDGSKILINDAGREFLKYLVDMRIPEPHSG